MSMDRAPQIITPESAAKSAGRPTRVALAVPSCDHVHANFAMAFAALTYGCGLRGIQMALVNTKGSMLPKNRDNAVMEARKYECDWILFLDSDMTFPPTAIHRLLAHDRDIVGATYARRSIPHDNLAKPKDQQGAVVQGLVEVDGLPTGCLLIRMSVFDKLARPYFRYRAIEEGEVYNGVPGPTTLGEDYGFCEAAKAAGFSIWMDTELSFDLVHWGEAGFRIKDADPAKPEEPGYEIIELQGTPA